MIKLVIFDLDGTLLDTISDLAVSTNFALEQCSFPTHKTSEYNLYVGNGITRLFERALPESERNEESILRMRSFFLQHYTQNNTCSTHPYEGISELLKSLSNRSIALAVASNKYQSGTEKLIQHYFGDIHFCSVLGQREGIPVKPDPSIVYEIIQTAGVKKEEAIYVGDSGVDMQTAKAAGITSIGVLWGFRTREELEGDGADYLVNSPQEILSVVLQKE